MQFQEFFRICRHKLFAPVVLLCACVAQPETDMSGAKQTDIYRNSIRYQVLQKGEVVEVRSGRATNSLWSRGNESTMISVIEEATGCKVREPTLSGNSYWMRGLIAC